MEMHRMVTAGRMQISMLATHVLHIRKTTIVKLLRSVIRLFPYRYQRIPMLATEGPLGTYRLWN